MTKKKAKSEKPKPKKLPKKIDLIEIETGQRCRARVKTCSKCGFKFHAGDKSWTCPECGEFRRCKSKAKYPYLVCRVHGAGGGRPPLSGKFVPPQQIADAYNAIYDDPSMLSLAFNIALSEARTNDLLAMIDDNDIRADAGKITTGINTLLKAAYATAETINRVHEMEQEIKKLESEIWQLQNPGKKQPKDGKEPEDEDWKIRNVDWFVKQADWIKDQLEPAVIEQVAWRQVNEQLEITRRLNDTERKWIDQHDQMVPMSTVLDSIAIVIRTALKFITSSADRSEFASQMRAMYPGIK